MTSKIISPISLVMVAMLGILLVGGFWGGYWWRGWQQQQTGDPVSSADNADATPKPLPLLRYSLENLRSETVTADTITLSTIADTQDDYLSVIFSYGSDGKNISGIANFPVTPNATDESNVTGSDSVDNEPSVTGTILMLRGFAPKSTYSPGVGTRNGGIYFARRGLVTWAPDFLGYADSDDEYADPWEARFAKPLQIKQLLANLRAGKFKCSAEVAAQTESSLLQQICHNQSPADLQNNLGIWAHSNGGQIALSTLEITTDNFPTTLWAPVSVGFPYGVLFFTDEEEDEGKGSRKFIAMLEEDYDADDFSHTMHLDWLPAGLQLQLHHGTSDDAALVAWSDEFTAKIERENDERDVDDQIELTYYRYPGADHNLRPAWDTVVARDLEFFRQQFTSAR